MALRLKDPPAPLRQVLQSQGMFGMGTQDNIRRSMDSTFANLRGVAPQANPFEPPAQEPSPSAPVASMVDGAPSIFGMTMGKPAESAISALPANLQVAGGLSRLEDAGKAYAFQTGLRDIGAANLNPEGQAPGDFMQSMKAAQSLYSRQYGPAGAGLAAGGTRMPNIKAFAPTGLRQRALAAGGAPVEGVGGAMVSASPNAQGGTNFALSQNPATVGAAPQAAPAPQAPAPQQSQYEADVNAYKQALQPQSSGLRLQSFEKGDQIITVDQNGNVVATAPRNVIPGYQNVPGGGVAPIKGSPQEKEATAAEEKKKKAAEEAIAKGSLIISKIDEAIPDVGVTTAGPIGAGLGMVPGTPAYDMQGTIDTIKANIGFDQLQAMRQASPTGGALGQVAVKELDFLQAALGNLDRKQSPERLKENLKQIRTHYNRWLQAYQGVHPDAGAMQAGFPEEKLKRLNELRAILAGQKEQEANQ